MPPPTRCDASRSPLRYLRACAFHGLPLGSAVMPEESTIHAAWSNDPYRTDLRTRSTDRFEILSFGRGEHHRSVPIHDVRNDETRGLSRSVGAEGDCRDTVGGRQQSMTCLPT